ncbi:MAG: hypothetical protein FJ356_05985 [Thaumarchaeota archaeon]|nr:hypothetical protein [Nitrososphaerota archaeon]
MAARDDNERFDEIVREFSLYKHSYNVQELQRIKTRAAQILGFLLVITSIIFAGMSAFALKEIKDNHLALAVFILGLVMLVVTMVWCYFVMIRRDLDPIIDPAEMDLHYRNQPLEETRNVLRHTLFDILNEMDTRNNTRHGEMLKIYWLAVSSLVIIFIPMIQAVISTIND